MKKVLNALLYSCSTDKTAETFIPFNLHLNTKCRNIDLPVSKT